MGVQVHYKARNVVNAYKIRTVLQTQMGHLITWLVACHVPVFLYNRPYNKIFMPFFPPLSFCDPFIVRTLAARRTSGSAPVGFCTVNHVVVLGNKKPGCQGRSRKIQRDKINDIGFYFRAQLSKTAVGWLNG